MDNEYYESRNVISYEIPHMFPVQDQRDLRYKVFESINQLLKVDNPDTLLLLVRL